MNNQDPTSNAEANSEQVKGEPEDRPTWETKDNHCLMCGDPMEPSKSVCYRCIDKAERTLELAKPETCPNCGIGYACDFHANPPAVSSDETGLLPSRMRLPIPEDLDDSGERKTETWPEFIEGVKEGIVDSEAGRVSDLILTPVPPPEGRLLTDVPNDVVMSNIEKSGYNAALPEYASGTFIQSGALTFATKKAWNAATAHMQAKVDVVMAELATERAFWESAIESGNNIAEELATAQAEVADWKERLSAVAVKKAEWNARYLVETQTSKRLAEAVDKSLGAQDFVMEHKNLSDALTTYNLALAGEPESALQQQSDQEPPEAAEVPHPSVVVEDRE